MAPEVGSRTAAARALIVLLAAAFAARFYLLFARPLWFDEIFTAWAARLPLGALRDALRLDSGPPGFYLLERPLAWLAGPDWTLRVPSFLAALALLLAGRTLPRGSRLPFVALASGTALIALYAVEARPYACLGLFAFGAFLLATAGVESPARLLALAACAAAALYSHYLAVFVVAALLAQTLASRRFRSALALLAGGAAFLPWIPVLRAQPPEAIAWMRESAAGSLAGFVSALGGVGRIPAPLGGPAPSLLFGAGLLAGLLLLAAVAAAAFGRREPGARDALIFVAMVLTGTLLIGAWRPVAFAGRTEMAVLPVWIWGVAHVCRGSRAARWGAAAAAALGTVATLVVAFGTRPGPTDAVTSALSGTARRGDVVVAAAGFYLPMRFEAERGRLAADVRALPESAAAHPGWFVPALPGEAEARLLQREVAALKPGNRLFLVVPPPYATPELVAALEGAPQAGRVPARELARSRDVVVMLRSKPPEPPPAPAAP